MLEQAKTDNPKGVVTRNDLEKNSMNLPDSLQVDGKTISMGYHNRLQLSGDHAAYLAKSEGRFQPVSWHDNHEVVLGIYESLKMQGLKKGDKACIMAHTCPEWFTTDLACLNTGIVSVPIYPSNTPEDIAYILENSEAKIVFAENEELFQKLLEAYKHLDKLIPTVLFHPNYQKENDTAAIDYKTFSRVKNRDQAQKDFETAASTIQPDDIASIVYTSGTTGKPKGVLLTQRNFVSGIRGVIQGLSFGPTDVSLLFLPLSHIFGREESISSIFSGMHLAFAESINAIPDNLVEVRPTLLVSVPRIFEKVYAKIISGVESSPPLKKNLFYWGVDVGRKVARLRSQQEPIPLSLQLKYKIADQLIFCKVRERMGGRIRICASGGAPLAADLAEFFHACGIKILEGYGLTETMAAIFANLPDNYRFGTVGFPLGDAEVKFDSDGEILLKGSSIFVGYYRNEEATKEAFTQDGWFRTGDIGEITESGHLKITDRKKELIITAGGKNIAPQKIENAIRNSHFISNCMAYGDQQKYLVALITLDEPTIRRWAKEQNIGETSIDALVMNEKVREVIDGELALANKTLAQYETVKKFHLLPKDFTVESGELTPSLKLKRRVITEKYKEKLLSMYTN